MNREAYETHLRAWEEYRNPGSTHAEAPRRRQPVEPRTGSSRRSLVGDALLDDPERDRVREQLKRHDRLRNKTHERTTSEERYPETLRRTLWDEEDVERYLGTQRESIGSKRKSIPKQESRVLTSSKATTDEETMKCHGKARAPLSTDRHAVDRERDRSKLSVPLVLTHIADYVEDSNKDFDSRQSYARPTSIDLYRKEEERKREEIKENHRRLCKLRKEADAAALASVQTPNPQPTVSNDKNSSRRPTHSTRAHKPSVSAHTRAQPSPAISTLDDRLESMPKHTKRERKPPDQRPILVQHSWLSNYLSENKITPSAPRPSSHSGSKNRHERPYASVADEMDSLLMEVGPETEPLPLRREDAA